MGNTHGTTRSIAHWIPPTGHSLAKMRRLRIASVCSGGYSLGNSWGYSRGHSWGIVIRLCIPNGGSTGVHEAVQWVIQWGIQNIGGTAFAVQTKFLGSFIWPYGMLFNGWFKWRLFALESLGHFQRAFKRHHGAVEQPSE